MGFDMTKTKVGDKLLTRGGGEVVFMENDQHEQQPFVIETADGWAYSVNMDGNLWTVDENPMDIVGFADEQSRTSEVVPEPENKGVKSDQGKTQWSYLPIPAVKAVVDVMAYGDTKYPAPDGSNWKRVPDAKKRYYNAAMRHLTSWWDGEQNDPETGYNHLAHACSNLLFLLWFEIKGYPETKE